jgi:exosortase
MKLIGIAVIRDGNIIMFPSITLEVADACSGIRSLLSILALSVAYASFLQISNLKRWVIILSSLLIAIATNAMRVIITGILASHSGAAAAQGFFHEFAGMSVFALAMAMLLAVGWLVRGKSS